MIGGSVIALGGSLCVRIYDVGNVTEPADYEIQVVIPSEPVPRRRRAARGLASQPQIWCKIDQLLVAD